MSDTVKRKITELRVVDLRSELERRGLDKSGVKATLIERLEQAMKTDGLDPNTYQFIVVESKKAPKKRKNKEDETNENDPEDDDDDEQGFDTSTDSATFGGGGENRGQNKEQENLVKRSGENSVNNNTNRQRQHTDDEEEELVVGVNDLEEDSFKIPNPENVEAQCQFTSEDTIKLHAASAMKKNNFGGGTISDEASSLFVNADDTLSDLDQTSDADGGTAAGGGGKTTAADAEDSLTTTNVAKASSEAAVTSTPTSVIVAPTTSNENENNTSVAKKELKATAADESGDKKANAKNAANSSASISKSVWVMGISSTTKAADLKNVFSKYGRVATTKVVSSKTKADGCKWFGFITMATPDDASKCIQHLHRTELHGKMISVERASSNNSMAPPKKVLGVVAGEVKNVPLSSTGVAPISSSSAESAAAADSAIVDASAKSAQDAPAPVKTDEQTAATTKDKATEKSSDATEKKKDETKEKSDKRHGSRSRSGSKDRRRSSKDRHSPRARRSRDRGTRREVTKDRPHRPMVARPSYRARPLMGRSVRPPPPRPPPPSSRPPIRAPMSTDYRRYQDRFRQIEIGRERERAMVEKMRQRDEEHRRREEVLRLQREKERLKAEREKLEREKLEWQTQQQQSRLAMFEARIQQQPQPSPLLGVKRPYDSTPLYPPSDPKRYSSSASASRSGRDRTPPRYAGSRDSYRSGDRYESRRVDSSSGRSSRDDYRTSSSSSRRQESVGSSGAGRMTRSGGGRFPSPPRRARDPPPPPPPPRPSWGTSGGGSSSTSSSRHLGGSAALRGDHRDGSASYSRQSAAYSSRSTTAAAPAWPGSATIVSNPATMARTGALPTAVSTNVWAPQQLQGSFFGGLPSTSMPSSGGTYATDNRFDAYKYSSNSSATRRY